MLGSEGLTKLEYTGSPLSESVMGQASGYIYPFDKRPVLYVDNRDLVYLLGSDFREVG